MEFTFEELADMVFVYGLANGNSRAAARLYHNRYPARRHPKYSIFPRIFRRLRETGNLRPVGHDRGRRRTTRIPDLEEEILDRVTEQPSISTRAVANEVGVDHSTVWRVLREQQLHPYHPQKVQALHPTDFAPRLVFSEWLVQCCLRDPQFHAAILFTDEACFTRDGVVNSRNSHVWADENPHGTIVHGHQQRFGVNIWAGIIGDKLIGPYLLPPRLNAQVYALFVQDTLPELLDDVPLDVRQRMWFQHDGAPAHFGAAARQCLDHSFPHRWIGRRGPVSWPARSPDLNPIDFFLWGYVKSLVYDTPVQPVISLARNPASSRGCAKTYYGDAMSASKPGDAILSICCECKYIC